MGKIFGGLAVTILANNRQHGGGHYRKREYQHWDFVCDCGLHYLLGCATKYVARWRDKGGKLDLEKALHYLDKAQEVGVKVRGVPLSKVMQFANQLQTMEGKIVTYIAAGDYEDARRNIQRLIRLADEEAQGQSAG